MAISEVLGFLADRWQVELSAHIPRGSVSVRIPLPDGQLLVTRADSRGASRFGQRQQELFVALAVSAAFLGPYFFPFFAAAALPPFGFLAPPLLPGPLSGMSWWNLLPCGRLLPTSCLYSRSPSSRVASTNQRNSGWALDRERVNWRPGDASTRPRVFGLHILFRCADAEVGPESVKPLRGR